MQAAPVLRSLVLVPLAALVASTAAAQDNTPKGVNPKENLSKLELIYKLERLDGDQRTDAFAFKFDRALTPLLGMNVELPIVRQSGPGLSETGIGDLQFRVRYNLQVGAVTLIPGLEVVAPTAAADVLGAGKWQMNPVIGGVVTLGASSFVFVGYKHLFSVAGDDARGDINASQPRLLAATVSPAGWWLLADAKYTRDWKRDVHTLDVELEAGQMLSANMGLSARIGTSALDSARNATLSVNWRLIF